MQINAGIGTRRFQTALASTAQLALRAAQLDRSATGRLLGEPSLHAQTHEGSNPRLTSLAAQDAPFRGTLAATRSNPIEVGRKEAQSE